MDSTLEDNLVEQVLYAFTQLQRESSCIKKETWKAPPLEATFDGKVLTIKDTRIRFDLWGYAFLGYRELSSFVDACWNDPISVVDELTIAEMIDPSLYRMSTYNSYTYRELKDGSPSIDPSEWKSGDKITLEKGVLATRRNYVTGENFLVRRSCYEVTPFFSPEGKGQVYLPSGTSFSVKEVSYSKEWYDDYGDTVVEHSLSGIGG